MKVNLPLFNQLTFKSKFVILMLFASIGSIVTIGWLGVSVGRRAMGQATFNRLVNHRQLRQQQVEDFFRDRHNHLVTLSEDRMVVAAMVELNKGFRNINQQITPPEWDQALKDYYATHVFPKWDQSATHSLDQVASQFQPVSQIARYLQHYYLSASPYAPSEKNQLVEAPDGSEYSEFHGDYHRIFRNLVQRFDYSDLYLINHKTGDIIYSVNKAPDFATNLLTGPYRNSHLATVTRQVQRHSDKGEVAIADFDLYRPANQRPLLFMAAPIYNGPYVVGILALGLDSDRLASLVADTQLPTYLKSSRYQDILIPQTFILGADRSLRATSQNAPSNPLTQTIKTTAAQSAVDGLQGTSILSDHRRVRVFTAYSPLAIEGLDWVILSQIEEAYVFAPMRRLQWWIALASILLVLSLTTVAMVAAGVMIRPIRQLNHWADQVLDGDFDAELDLILEDELGQLVDTLQIMVTNLSHQVATLDQKMGENQLLLTNLVPEAIAKRMRKGEAPIADHIKQVTLLYARVEGMAELSTHMAPERVTEFLSTLMHKFDAAAERHGLEKQRALDTNYMAICGLTIPHLDHTRRTVDFALEMVQILHRAEFGRGLDLGLRIGIHSGPVTAGVLSSKQFSYNVWGESVYLTLRLHAHIPMDTIVATDAAYAYIADAYTFSPLRPVTIPNVGQVERWRLVSRDRLDPQYIETVQTSFVAIEPKLNDLAEAFYRHVGEQRPDLRSHFSLDHDPEGQVFSRFLAKIVADLRQPGTLLPLLYRLLHEYQPRNGATVPYSGIKTALLDAIAETLADDYTEMIHQAWEESFLFLSHHLQEMNIVTEQDLPKSKKVNLNT